MGRVDVARRRRDGLGDVVADRPRLDRHAQMKRRPRGEVGGGRSAAAAPVGFVAAWLSSPPSSRGCFKNKNPVVVGQLASAAAKGAGVGLGRKNPLPTAQRRSFTACVRSFA